MPLSTPLRNPTRWEATRLQTSRAQAGDTVRLVGSAWVGWNVAPPHPKLHPFVALWVVDPRSSNLPIQFLKRTPNLDIWIKHPVFKKTINQ